MTPPFKIRALGEIAIRCDDLGPMAAFYGDVLGLERMEGSAAPGPAPRSAPGIVFFRIAEGFGGHTQILALFEKDATTRPGLHPSGADAPRTGAGSSLHHIALTVRYADQDAIMAWYDQIGLTYRVEHFGWVGWRGVFTTDPEGNTVELVAFDLSLKD